MTNHIFLSYAESDEREARALADALPEHQFTGWRNESLRAGDSLGDRMREELTRASALVVILSEQSLSSPWVKFEFGAAMSMGIPIVPVFVGRAGELPTPEWTRGIRPVDARGKSPKEAAAEIVEELAKESAHV